MMNDDEWPLLMGKLRGGKREGRQDRSRPGDGILAVRSLCSDLDNTHR